MASTAGTVGGLVRELVRAWSGGPAADDRAWQGLVTSAQQAYAVQEELVRALGDPSAPACPRHWKSGAPSSADAPKHAPLPSAGVRPSGGSLAGLHLRHHWVEAEVALRLGRDVTPAQAQQLVLPAAPALVDAMCVSIEIVDTRWAAGREAPPLLRFADLLMHGALVLGAFVPFGPRAWDRQECRVRIGDGGWQSFRGSLGIGEPPWVLPAWLQHATRDGATVPAGTIVTTGTWCGLLEAAAGDLVSVEFPGIGAAAIQL